jgi:hypothetical protein
MESSYSTRTQHIIYREGAQAIKQRWSQEGQGQIGGPTQGNEPLAISANRERNKGKLQLANE